jgi:hypothetical protein
MCRLVSIDNCALVWSARSFRRTRYASSKAISVLQVKLKDSHLALPRPRLSKLRRVSRPAKLIRCHSGMYVTSLRGPYYHGRSKAELGRSVATVGWICARRIRSEGCWYCT